MIRKETKYHKKWKEIDFYQKSPFFCRGCDKLGVRGEMLWDVCRECLGRNGEMSEFWKIKYLTHYKEVYKKYEKLKKK